MEEGGVSIWMITVIGGPIVLGLVLALGVLRSRRRRRQLERAGTPAGPADQHAAARERERTDVPG